MPHHNKSMVCLLCCEMFSLCPTAHPGLRFLLKANTSTSHWCLPLNSCQRLVGNTVIHQPSHFRCSSKEEDLYWKLVLANPSAFLWMNHSEVIFFMTSITLWYCCLFKNEWKEQTTDMPTKLTHGSSSVLSFNTGIMFSHLKHVWQGKQENN